MDSSLPLDDNDREIMELLSGRKSIVIYNKTDLEAAVDIEELKEKENIKISSLDSLLSNINNYYDDEIYLNKLIIGEIAL